MKKTPFIIVSLLLAFAIAIVLVPVQNVKALGPSFEEGSDGFQVVNGTSYTWRFTAMSTDFASKNNMSVGDKVRLNITATNNSNTIYLTQAMAIWEADTIFGTIEYYNSTNHTWGGMGGPVTEMFFMAYNSSVKYTYPSPINIQGLYNFADLMSMYLIVPNNWAVTNHTIVNKTYSNFPQDFSHTETLNVFSWTIQNGSSTDPGAFKTIYNYNSKEILLKSESYSNGTTDWELNYRLELEGQVAAPSLEDLLMLAATGGGGFFLGDFIAIGIVAGIIIVPLIIGLGIRKASG
ncbi:MAG: hypothetical protein ACTSRG_00120 [Candidatus Helarchaeota archaeon]